VKAHITQLDLLLKETEVRVACGFSGDASCRDAAGTRTVFSEVFQSFGFFH